MAILPGDYGKVRPVLVVQSDDLGALDSVMACPLTSELAQAGLLRVTVQPTARNGLQKTSEVMADKLTAVPVRRFRDLIGSLEPDLLMQVEGRIVALLGLAD